LDFWNLYYLSVCPFLYLGAGVWQFERRWQFKVVMKRTSLIFLFFGLILIAIIRLLAISIVQNRKSVQVPNPPANSPVTNVPVQNVEATSTILRTLVGKSETNAAAASANTNEQVWYFKAVTNSQTGQYEAVSSDARSVVLRDKFGKVIWSNNVVAFVKTLPVLFFNNKIDSMGTGTNVILVHAGNAYVVIDEQSGQIKDFGTR
jgi:hypothetical protein